MTLDYSKLRERLFELKDEKNADFQAKLTPGIARETFLGARTPQLRLLEKEFRKKEEANLFLKALPHEYYDENLLHSIFISNMKDYNQVMAALDEFLPYMDNWAVCDTLHPVIFKKQKDGLMEKIHQWVASPETYTCRFGINILMTYYLDDHFLPEYLEIPASVHSEEYYINMMIAWYYATALAKQWDATIPYLEQNRLDTWVHNKTIQKARESFRIRPEQKEYLKTLKRK